MRKAGFILFIFCLVPFLGLAQKIDHKLQNQIEALVRDFHGGIGVYVKNLKTGKSSAFQADTVFPTASMIKVSILLGIMQKIEIGELNYHDEMIYKDSLFYPGVDILGSFKNGEKIELSKLLMLMLTMSDNTASLWLQSMAGGGSRINALLDSLGLTFTRVNSRTEGRESNRDRFGWGQTTPREMSTLIEKIFRNEALSRKSTEKMVRLLGRNYWDEEGLSQIPPGIFVASKNGAVDESRSQTLLVMAPHGPFLLTVMTKDQADTSWQPQNEGWVLIRKITNLVWDYFEPHYGWVSTNN